MRGVFFLWCVFYTCTPQFGLIIFPLLKSYTWLVAATLNSYLYTVIMSFMCLFSPFYSLLLKRAFLHPLV